MKLRPLSPSAVMWGTVVLAVSTVSLLLRQAVPVTAFGSVYDDLLFLRGARYLVHGQWLGPFDSNTLAKGPSYPALVALSYQLGLPLRMAEQLTYLAAAGAVAACVLVVTRRRPLAVGAYIVLALDPVNFSVNDSLVFRDGWYSSLSLLLLASIFLSVYGSATRGHWLWVMPVSVLAGLVGAAFWLCREEGPWILPAVAVVLLGVPLTVAARSWHRRRELRDAAPRRAHVLRRTGRVAVTVAVVGVCFVVPIGAVTRENGRQYGANLTNDLASGNFARAFADWSRVEAGTDTPGIPISRAQREAVYAVSPAARELEQFLELPTNHFRSNSCHVEHLCDDLSGAFTVWAVREAAASAGHFGSGSDVEAYFATVDQQIQAACADGRLSCRARLPTAAQTLDRFRLDAFVTSFRRSAGRVLASRGFGTPPPGNNVIGARLLSRYSDIVRDMPDTQRAATAQMVAFRAHGWRYDALARGYVLLMPVLIVLALIGLVWGLVRPRWRSVALAALTIGFAVAAVGRLGFVALLDTTQFPTIDEIRYQLPTHAMLMGAATVGTALLADRVWSRVRRPRTANATPSGPEPAFCV